MIKTTILFVATILLSLTSLQSNASSITGTPHDLSNRSMGSTETCKFCHIPHNANPNKVSPLWNRIIGETPYKIYTSDSRKTDENQPTLTSQTRLCLSCHDGSTAMDVGEGSHMIDKSKVISLTTDHPVSVMYANNPVVVAGKFKQATSTKFVDANLQLPLYGGNLECGTCHNPHDNQFGSFLRVSNAKSELCFSCHIM